MSELLPLSVGIGLAVSLLLTELFGIAAGGMIVPGYMALHLGEPTRVLWTLLAGLFTYAVVHAMGSILIIYGRRRTVLMILVGYCVGMLFRSAAVVSSEDPSMAVIGFIIPGLIAIWFERQGVVETLCSLATASVLVRMILILTVGTEL